MREIKFRAWDKEEKKMTEPFGLALLINRFNDESDYNRYCDTDLAKLNYQGGNEYEVMQFTGLKDKNGKEIYEGDIVKLDSWEGLQVICFIEGAFCLANKDEEFLGDIHYIQHAGVPQATVIGNIYENPELIKS